MTHSNRDFQAVFAHTDGIGGFDLTSASDRVLAFDYEHTGKLDHLCLYRPGTGAFFIIRNNGGVFEAVYAQGDPGSGIGGYDLKSLADQALAFDFDRIVLYRPGKGAVFVLKNEGGQFFTTHKSGESGDGIAGYDLRSKDDQLSTLDYDSSGRSDHLVLFRPGTGIIWILKKLLL